MKKGIYFILAFVFYAESSSRLTVENDGRIFIDNINSSNEIGNIEYLARHLVNNGHIIFKNEVVKNISDLKQIVRNRYGKLCRNIPKNVDERICISYFKINNDFSENIFSIRVVPYAKDLLFGTRKNIPIKIITKKNNSVIKISFSSIGRKSKWHYVSSNTEKRDMPAPEITIVLLKKEKTWIIATAYAYIDENW